MPENNIQCDVLVIGGGPAGMMAAVAASQNGAKVVLVEKNPELGIKLMMTGKGRCNITNAEKDLKKFLEMFGKHGKFLYHALNVFGPEETVEFFENHGLATKTERGNRVFPESDRAQDVRGVLLSQMMKGKVMILKNSSVYDFVLKDGRIVTVKIKGERRAEILAERVVIATGGLSYPFSGSSGDGLSWAERLGHKIVKPVPALTPVVLKEKWIGELEGLSLKNVRIDVYQSGKKKDERFGEAIFTSDGMSGPIILDASRKIGELLQSGQVVIRIDFKPALDFGELDRRIQRDFQENMNRFFRNSLGDLLPEKMIPVLIRLSGIDPDKRVNLITREERVRLVHLLKEFDLNVLKLLGFEKAIVTSGGIDLREVDPKIMNSKIVENLYFAGEVLDLDAPTGGYNLQECWSTGYVAGISAAGDL
jgi:predicted Rossmann fold flavoprotein